MQLLRLDRLLLGLLLQGPENQVERQALLALRTSSCLRCCTISPSLQLLGGARLSELHAAAAGPAHQLQSQEVLPSLDSESRLQFCMSSPNCSCLSAGLCLHRLLLGLLLQGRAHQLQSHEADGHAEAQVCFNLRGCQYNCAAEACQLASRIMCASHGKDLEQLHLLCRQHSRHRDAVMLMGKCGLAAGVH